MKRSETATRVQQAPPTNVSGNIAVPMRDGSVLRGNLYRPDDGGRYPVIVSYTPYGKDVHVRDVFPPTWKTAAASYPEILRDILAASSGARQTGANGGAMPISSKIKRLAGSGYVINRGKRKARHFPARNARIELGRDGARLIAKAGGER